jgi:hypothetical protein
VLRSPLEEDEAARAALGWKPGGRGDSLGIWASVFRARMMKLPRGSCRSKRDGPGDGLEVGSSVIRTGKVKLLGQPPA